ncbi:MAG TPA: hypothetical protein VFS12_19310 [Terriglobia bacterium]|nr:hypothetical protein [Terriglobia bacterium]
MVAPTILKQFGKFNAARWLGWLAVASDLVRPRPAPFGVPPSGGSTLKRGL